MDLKAIAEGIKATTEAIQAVMAVVEDAACACAIEVNNTSSRTLSLEFTKSTAGGFSGGLLPPDLIGPLSTHVFAHRTTGGILTGSAGRAGYRIEDGETWDGGDGIPKPNDLYMIWNNPFAGRNSFNAGPRVGAPFMDWYVTKTFTGDGSHAHMRVIFGEQADFGPSDKDWLPCGACKALFDARDESSKCPSSAFDTGIEDQRGHHIISFGNHAVAGSAFRLPESRPGANREPGWRKCTNCKALFYDGFSDKGVCVGRRSTEGEVDLGLGTGAAEGLQNIWDGHVAEGPDFHLAFDMPLRPWQQKDWRWCDKCYELFYFPQNADAECAAGEHHHAHPYNYVLDYA